MTALVFTPSPFGGGLGWGLPPRQKPARQMRRNSFAGVKRLALQRGGGEQVQAVAVNLHAWLHQLQDPAGALGDPRGFGVRRPHQRCGHGRFALVQPMRSLAKQRAAERVNADQLAAKRHQIQISLQNLVLAPARFQRLRPDGLADFLCDAAPTRGCAPVVVEQAGQLHAERRSAACFRVP